MPPTQKAEVTQCSEHGGHHPLAALAPTFGFTLRMSDYGPSPVRLARLPGKGSHSEGELALPATSPFAVDVHCYVLFWLRPFFGIYQPGLCDTSKVLTEHWLRRSHGAVSI